MEHIQDIYVKKPEMVEKLFDHLTKVDFNITGKSFHVFYNEAEDDLEYHTHLVGDDNTSILPLDVIDRLFSESIDNAINHIEERKEAFKNYIFLSFKIISEKLFLTSAITKNNKLVDDPDELLKISEELEIDTIPSIHQGNLSESQKEKIIEALSNNVSPNDKGFIKDLFGDDIDISENYNGFVFSYDVGGKIVKYEFSDEQSSNILENKIDESKLQTIHETFVDWVKDNASKLDNNSMESIELNFIEMMEDPKRFNKLMGLATELTTSNIDKDHSLQLDKVCENLRKNVQRHGKVYELLYENFLRLFWNAKKRNFTISKEFQQDVNKICGMVGESLIIEDDEEHGKIELDNGDIFTYTTNNEQLKNLFDRMKVDEKFRSKIINFGNYQTGDFRTKAIKWLTLKKIDELHAKKALSELKDAAIENNCLSELIKLIDSQFDGTKLRDNKKDDANKKDDTYFDLLKIIDDDNFTKIEILPEITRFLENYKFNKEFINDIYNITTGPQPEMGRGELLIKMLVYPGNIQKGKSTDKNNDDEDIKGDIYCDGCAIEIKSPRKKGAKVGNSNCSTAAIYTALGLKPNCNIDITYKRLTEPISYSYKGKETSMMLPNYNENDKNKTLLEIINENVIKAEKVEIDGINVKKILTNIFKDDKNHATSFLNLMLAINLVRYSISEKFDIFCVDLSNSSEKDAVTFNDLLFIRLKKENHELIENVDELVSNIYTEINNADSKICCTAVRLSGSNNSCTIQLK